jgi:hypothetical protein
MIAPQLSLARSMLKLISSKLFASNCFIFLIASASFQILIHTDDILSSLVAVLPTLIVITMAWLAAIRLTFPKSKMLDSNNVSLKGFRGLCFLFFLSGAFFHCIDFLGVEQTLEWGTGMGFAFLLTLAICFWDNYIVRTKLGGPYSKILNIQNSNETL